MRTIMCFFSSLNSVNVFCSWLDMAILDTTVVKHMPMKHSSTEMPNPWRVEM